MRALLPLLLAGCGFRPGTALVTGDGSPPSADAPRDARAIDARPDAPPDAPLGIRFIQAATGYATSWNSGGASIAATFSAPVAAGDTLALYVTYASAGSISGVDDTAGDTFLPVDAMTSNGNNGQASADYYAANVHGAAVVTVTVHFNSFPCCRELIVHDIAGASTTSPLDVHSTHHQGNTSTSTDGVDAGNFTTHAADYIFAATSDASNAGGQAITAGTGERIRASSTPSGDNPMVSEDRVQTAAGSASSTFTFAQSGDALSMQMAFTP